MPVPRRVGTGVFRKEPAPPNLSLLDAKAVAMIAYNRIPSNCNFDKHISSKSYITKFRRC